MDRFARGKADLIFLALTLAVSIYCCYRAYYNYEETREEFLNAGLRLGFLMFFFWLGICYRRFIEPRIREYINIKLSVFFFLAVAIIHSLTRFKYTYNTRNMNLAQITLPNGFWVAVAAPIIAIVFFLGIAYSLEPYLSGDRALIALGQNTKYVVYYHQLCFCLCSYAIASLIEYNILPDKTFFETKNMRKTAYYCGGSHLSLLVSIISIVLPVFICSTIRKLKNKWLIALCYFVLFLLVILYLYLAKKAIY